MLHQDMTDAEFEPFFAKAQQVSAYFREIGTTYDVENTFAYPTVAVFKDSGLGAVPIPKEYGGHGGNILHASKIISELSRGDSAIALAYNMHYITLGIAGNLMTETQRKHWMGRAVDGAIMFAPWSEKRAGFSGLADMKAIPQSEGGWRLYGTKNWGTLSEAADIVGTTATITDPEGNMPESFEERVSAESFFMADWKVDQDGRGDGIRIEKTWNALGMHATGTHMLHFDGFYVPEDGFICELRTGAFSVLEWASLMFASIYLGMQARVLEEARATLSTKTLGAVFGAVVAEDVKVANVGHIIDGIGDMAIRHELSRRVLHRTCQELIDSSDDNWPSKLRVPYIGLAKIFIADNVIHMTKHAMSMVGGSAYRKGTIFERLYRDSAASLYQPLNADQTRTYIGEYLLQPEESGE